MRRVAAGLLALLLVATVGTAVYGVSSPICSQTIRCHFEDPPWFSVHQENLRGEWTDRGAELLFNFGYDWWTVAVSRDGANSRWRLARAEGEER